MEAAWATEKWSLLERYVDKSSEMTSGDFNVDIGHALFALHKGDIDKFASLIGKLRESIAKGLSRATTASLQACREELLKLHVLSEIELISGAVENTDRETALKTLDLRLPILGAFLQDKQFLLGLRRAAMQLSRYFHFLSDDNIRAERGQLGVQEGRYGICMVNERPIGKERQASTASVQCGVTCISARVTVRQDRAFTPPLGRRTPS